MELIEAFERAITILKFLDQAHKDYNIFQLSQELDMRRGTLANHIKAMEKLGWVKTEMLKNVVPPQKIVKITEKGRCIVRCLSD